MRSSSGHQWEIRRHPPRELRRFSLLSVVFFAVITASLLAAGFGIFLARRPQVEPGSFIPYGIILVSTAVGIIFASVVWAAAGRPVERGGIDFLGEDGELEPVHLQKWTYQESCSKGYVAAVVSGIWHGVGLLACGHYCFVTWPQISPGMFPFLAYELVGLIPLALALKGWRERRGLSDG